jgi:hypothetical protein
MLDCMISQLFLNLCYSQFISNRLFFAVKAKVRKYNSFQNPIFSRILIAAIHTY